MGIGDKVMDALRTGVMLNERVNMQIGRVDRMDQDLRRMNERLIRLETIVEMAQMQPVDAQSRRIE